MPEKLLTLKELSVYLDISEVEIQKLVDVGVIPAYRLGGSFLRFRKDQIDAVKEEISTKKMLGDTMPKITIRIIAIKSGTMNCICNSLA